jgi:hypothetical protein
MTQKDGSRAIGQVPVSIRLRFLMLTAALVSLLLLEILHPDAVLAPSLAFAVLILTPPDVRRAD